MATVKKNLELWDKTYDWKHAGDNWSNAWGGVGPHWYFTILPRIHTLVPTDTILEIAPGFGRWTQYLALLCKNLIVVDLSEKCVQHCKERFKRYSHITYYANDGKSLAMIPNDSIDLVFSYDSLVHAEDDVIEAYVSQLSKKLKRGGSGFIHHSNAGSYENYRLLVNRIPRGKIKKYLLKRGLIENIEKHQRAGSMTADKFRHYARQAGLQCVTQEIINYDTCSKLIDCITVFKKKISDKEYPAMIIKNTDFVKEAAYVQKLSSLYGMRER